ncbi:MAG: TROVE domain-containing protein, partial [Chloroflexota bacterium]
LTVENAQNVLACIQTDGARTVQTIVDVSQGGRAPKNDPAIFALALAASAGDDATRRLALNAVPAVCRTATHLFSFVDVIKGMRGWGRGLRNAISAWYTEKETRKLAYQVVKYRQRNSWTHTDTLRKAHPQPTNATQGEIFKWITRRDEVTWADSKTEPEDEALQFIWAFEQVQSAQNVQDVLRLVAKYDLPREALPTQWLKTSAVWDALLQTMPMTAMIRNLGNMSKCGLLVPGSDAEALVIERLGDVDRLHRARIHPLSVLTAMRVYANGYAMRGGYSRRRASVDATWSPVPRVVDALDEAFDLAFQTITPSNKRTMIALDVSGSMGGGMIAGIPNLSPRMASAAMAMVTARTEPAYHFTAFQHEMVSLNISAKMSLDTVVDTISGLPFGATDCAQPMLYALDKGLQIDTFIVYTDNETWYGQVHPAQA